MERVHYGGFTKEFSYSYYKNGLKKAFTAPDGTMYTYQYGLNNELREVQIPGVCSIAIPDYTWNRPAKMVFPGGTQRTYGYDALMRLKTLTATDPGGNPLLDYAYTYNEAGNIMTKATEHGEYAYDYDDVSRLISADNPVLDDESYTYDNVGNRLTSADVSGSWSYNTNNELLGFGDVEYEYDDNGNMTQKRVGTAAVNYIYDAANRLVKVEDDTTQAVIAEYAYDPFGRRLWKDVGGTRTYFFYSDEGLIGEYDASGTEIKTYGYKPDSTWTTDPLFMKQGTEYYFYQNDHLGTPQKLVAMNGAVVWSAQYTAFGKADVQVETVINNLRMPGQFCDVETGLYYNLFRYYDPKLGRYLRVDPLGFGGGDRNLYGYAHNNSVNRSDSLGMWAANLTMLVRIFGRKSLYLQDETHESLTRKAFDGMSSNPLSGWRSVPVIRGLLIAENINQDLTYNVISKLLDDISKLLGKVNLPSIPPADPECERRHYGVQYPWTWEKAGVEPRWMSRVQARNKYLYYLDDEKKRFDARVGASSHTPTIGDCWEALRSLGRLSHSWQDYYGHGVTSDAQCRTRRIISLSHTASGYGMNVSCLPTTSAYNFPGGVNLPSSIDLGSPERGRVVLWPIVTDKNGQPGEHPEGGVEPVHLGSPESHGYAERVAGAIMFTRQKFEEYLKIWAGKCQCYDEQFSELPIPDDLDEVLEIMEEMED